MADARDLTIAEIDDVRLDHLADVWRDSPWFPPFNDSDSQEEKRRKLRDWLRGERYMLKARRNVR